MGIPENKTIDDQWSMIKDDKVWSGWKVNVAVLKAEIILFVDYDMADHKFSI